MIRKKLNVLRSETVDAQRKRRAQVHLSREIVLMKHLIEQCDEIWNDVASKAFLSRTKEKIEKRSDTAYEIVNYLRDREDDDTVEGSRRSMLCKKLLSMLKSLKLLEDLEMKNRIKKDLNTVSSPPITQKKENPLLALMSVTRVSSSPLTSISSASNPSSSASTASSVSSTSIAHSHYPGCGCLPPVPSLFEMARRRKEYMKRKKMQESEELSTSG